MPWVTVQPSGLRLEVGDDESVAEAAWRQGYVWPTQCWGQADCITCFTKIIDGELSARPAEQRERDAIRLKMSGRMKSSALVRLACQLKVTGDDLVLDKVGVRAEAPEDNNALAQPLLATDSPRDNE